MLLIIYWKSHYASSFVPSAAMNRPASEKAMDNSKKCEHKNCTWFLSIKRYIGYHPTHVHLAHVRPCMCKANFWCYCVCVKHITLSRSLCSSSSSSLFSASHIREFRIVYQYSWFLKSHDMVNRGGKFSFFQGINRRIDVRVDISISTRPMATKFVKQVHLQELSQMRLIKQMLVTSSRQYHGTN